MGEVAVRGADWVVMTSDNPRSEDPMQIMGDAIEGLGDEDRDRVDMMVKRSEAIAYAISMASAGDVVLIAGKGHERDQVMADEDGQLVAHAFDDVLEARKGLDARRGVEIGKVES